MSTTEQLHQCIHERNVTINQMREQNKRQAASFNALRCSEIERLARALHMTDPDVLVFACERGEASERPDGARLLDRGPKVIEAVETMWDRDEMGLKTVWMERAERVMDLFAKKAQEELEEDDYDCPSCSGEDD
jgi:hypothetical protein